MYTMRKMQVLYDEIQVVEKRRLHALTVAMRMSQAEAKGWKEFEKTLAGSGEE